MSICTKTGDLGTTGLMYNRRVSKSHARIEACGTLDELNAAVGLARASSQHPIMAENLLSIQKELIEVMGELAVLPEDLARYEKDGFKVIGPERAAKLETMIKELEAQKISFKGWATPGASVEAGTLDVARTVCRRSERRVQQLLETKEIQNQNILIYLNRLSDLLWLLARWVETRMDTEATQIKT